MVSVSVCYTESNIILNRDIMKPDEQQSTSPSQGQPTDPVSNQPVNVSPDNDNPSVQPSGSVVSPTDKPVAFGDSVSTAPEVPASQSSAQPEPRAHFAPLSPPNGDPALPSVMSGKSLVVGGEAGSQSYDVNQGERKTGISKKKKLLLSGGILAALLLFGGGYVFGFYIPNKPENVWKTGLNRTGMAIDSLVEDATSKDKLDKLTASEMRGNLSVKGKTLGNISGSFAAQFDKESGNLSLDVSIPQDGTDNAELSAKVLLEVPAKEQYPDVYFKLAGFTALGLDGLVPGVNGYDGKWISVSNDFIKKNLDKDGASTKQEDMVTASEAAEVARVATKTTREYVLTTDPDKAVVVNKGFKGKEKVDGVNAYHYKAGLNKNHVKAYCQALITNVSKTTAFKKLIDEKDRAERTKESIDTCKDNADDIKDNFTFDLWVDAKYKLIHKVRMYKENSTKNYVDIGQTYKGDDTLRLFAKLHDVDNPTELNSTLQVNFKTMKVNGTLDGYTGKGDSKYTFDATYSLEASDKKVSIEKPASSVSIEDVFEQLGLGGMMGSDTQLTANDVDTRDF